MTVRNSIYLVMHDQDLASEFESLLKAKEFSVEVIGSSKELFGKILEDPPRVIILGVLLPDANGLEVSKQIKQTRQTSHVKIVIISSLKRSSKFSMEAKTKFGADLYLEMPLEAPDFYSAIDALFGISETAEEEEPAEKTIPEEVEEKPQEKPEAFEPEPPAATVQQSQIPPPLPIEETAAPKPIMPLMVTQNQGRLGPVLLPELLLSLYQRHVNGTLVLKSWEEHREILIRDGLPIAIRSNFIPDDALGQILIARKVADRATIETALAEAKKEGLKLGEMLVQQGKLAERELKNILRNQAKRKMNSAFRWKEGSFEFTPGQLDERDSLPIEQDMLSILIAGIGRHYDLHKLEERLYLNKDAVIERTDLANLVPEDLNISRHEWQLINLINGERTLGEVIAESDLNFARTFQVLYLFMLFGLVRFKGGDRFFRIEEAVAYRVRSEAGQAPSSEVEEKIGTEKEDQVLSYSGDLSQVSLVRFLYQLFNERATGKLIVTRDEHEELLFLSAGMPVRIHSSRIGPNTLGNLLIEQGNITELERDRSLDMAKQTGKPLGEMLLTEGLISPHDLYEALMAQLENKLIVLFTWEKGNYVFNEGSIENEQGPPITVDLTKLVIRSVGETVHTDRIELELGKYRSFPLMRTRANLDLVSLFNDPRESALVAMVDGRKTLGEILERTLVERSRALQMIYSLLQLGLVKFKEE